MKRRGILRTTFAAWGMAVLGIAFVTGAATEAAAEEICLKNEGAYAVQLKIRYFPGGADSDRLIGTGGITVNNTKCLDVPGNARDLTVRGDIVWGNECKKRFKEPKDMRLVTGGTTISHSCDWEVH